MLAKYKASAAAASKAGRREVVLDSYKDYHHDPATIDEAHQIGWGEAIAAIGKARFAADIYTTRFRVEDDGEGMPSSEYGTEFLLRMTW